MAFSSAYSYSFDSPTHEENDDIPLEFLHGRNPTGLLLAHLTLKMCFPLTAEKRLTRAQHRSRASIIINVDRVVSGELEHTFLKSPMDAKLQFIWTVFIVIDETHCVSEITFNAMMQT